jgi:hypothetical protein
MTRGRMSVAGIALLTLVMGAATADVAAQGHEHQLAGALAVPVPPLATTCRPAVAGLLTRGMAHFYSAHAVEAAGTFRQAAHSDVDCSMAYWGTAMAYWAQWEQSGRPEMLAEGWRALDQAGLLKRVPSDRERRYLEAVTVLYRERLGQGPDRAAELFLELAKENDQDQHAALLAAWATGRVSGGGRSLALRGEALRLLAGAGHAQHGVAGLRATVEAGDARELAARVLPQARALAAAPDAPPLLIHLSSHIFLHLGLWDEAVTANRRAADAAVREHAAGDELHALDALTFALLRANRGAEAAAIAERVAAGHLAEVSGTMAAYERSSIVARVAIECDAPALADAYAARSAPSWTAEPLDLARRVAAARRGETWPQAAATDTATEFRKAGAASGRIAAAWQAFALGHHDQAVRLLEKAVEVEAGDGAASAWTTPLVPATVHLESLRQIMQRPARSRGRASRLPRGGCSADTAAVWLPQGGHNVYHSSPIGDDDAHRRAPDGPHG